MRTATGPNGRSAARRPDPDRSTRSARRSVSGGMNPQDDSPLRVIGYVRVSTESQGRDGYGLRAQIERLRRECEYHGWELVTVIPDVMSTRRTARMHGRAAAVAAVAAGVADAVLITVMDRATRSVLDGAQLQAECREARVRLLSTDGYDSDDENTQFTADVKIAAAAEERRLISKRTREGLAQARAEGKVLGRISVVPTEVVERIHSERAAGLTLAAIAAGLDADGVPTPGTSPVWRPRAVRDIAERAMPAVSA